MVPPASRNRTNTLLTPGSNGTPPRACTNTENVGVSLAPIVVETRPPADPMHAPVVGSVSHREMFSGRVALPVSAVTSILPPAPTLTVATENALTPELPGRRTTPSALMVSASATTSGTGSLDADSCTIGVLQANHPTTICSSTACAGDNSQKPNPRMCFLCRCHCEN